MFEIAGTGDKSTKFPGFTYLVKKTSYPASDIVLSARMSTAFKLH